MIREIMVRNSDGETVKANVVAKIYAGIGVGARAYYATNEPLVEGNSLEFTGVDAIVFGACVAPEECNIRVVGSYVLMWRKNAKD